MDALAIHAIRNHRRADCTFCYIAPMRLGDVLELEVLQEAGLRIATGADQMDRPVRWVHSGEIADIAQFLSGGEVLLTAATGLRSPTADRRGYVRALAETGAVALVIELGRAFTELPTEMAEEAEHCGLVIAVLEREVPFAAVTRIVHTAILNEQNDAQTRATAIGDDFSRLVLEGAHVPEMLELLARRLNNPVVLEDGLRRVVAYGTGDRQIAPILRQWHRHSRQGHQGQLVGVQTAESEPRCVWTSVALRGEIWGRLHVLEVDTPIDSVAQMALGRAASNIALYLLAERDAYLSESAERSLVTDAARRTNFSGDEFLARATGLGVDFGDDLVMIMLSSEAPSTALDEELLKGFEQTIRDRFRQFKWPSVVGRLSGEVVAVASAAPTGGLRGRLELMSADLQTGGFSHRVGVSRPTKASLLRRAYAEAQTAYDLGPAMSPEPVHHYEDLVLHRMLTPLVNTGPQLANFVESELGDLIAYDEEHGTNLLSTLDAFLQSNGNKAATADILFLQRRSVYYRLTRIEDLLGRSLEPADHRVRLYVALRAREVLTSSAHGDSLED
jgi:PucR family transcriptional regulator, purine catabolism regulatory protein